MTIMELIRKLTKDLNEKREASFVDLYEPKEAIRPCQASPEEVTERISAGEVSLGATFSKSCR